MEWMKLTAPDFVKALKTSGGVCVLPVASIEKHGNHLPLGIDTYNTEARVREACERAGVVMFPVIPFMENSEAMNNPGGVAVPSEVLIPFLRMLMDEIGRNGFRKIVLVSGHGGNVHLMSYLLQDFLRRGERNYMLYLCTAGYGQGLSDELLTTEIQDHAGERETAISLHNVPGLVKMENVPGEAVPKRGRWSHLKDARPAVWWCADVPGHYVGDARPATAEMGRRFHEDLVARMTECFRSVRKDKKTAGVYREYIKRRERGGLPG